ncbi:hybrid sensor histidine kinase/response regulator [Chitinophaga sp. GbtcB8]|uniref:hybrid sensor histidine kinase/response regulator n=1 Tax=Chitinophaga sp. GbtcB8 TaxID=2824753 RepID=UPI001C2FC12A|nr:hybrid sensor histidine kinase/response regulator [Chitinophaga sp. GbtcB8]
MQSKRIKYYLLGLFLTGMILFIILQFNSSKNIRKLISGNEQVLQELRVKNELQKLQTNMAKTDSKVRGTVISQDTLHVTGIEAEIAIIKSDLNTINKMMLDDSTEKLLTQLNYLVDEKNNFNVQVLDTFYGPGKKAAEKVINSEKGKRLGEAINTIIHLLDSTRQTVVNRTVHIIDTSGQKAQSWGTILVCCACIASLLGFLYIISRIHQQEQLIDALDQSQQKERKLSAIKEQFLANMSHEIRTPMNAVLGFTRLLQGQSLNDKSKEYVSAIQSAGENLLDIINDILDISKIEAGMMRLEPVSFSLRGSLHSLQTMFLPKAVEKHLSLVMLIEDNVPDILYGDVLRLTQVLVNLTNNAIKFTNEGAVTIRVSLVQQHDSNVRILFTVKDTGIGIATDKLPYIFDRFNQAEANTTRKYGGTALGLAIVKQLVELQHGKASVESQPGKGSTFTIELPYTLGEVMPESGTELYNGNGQTPYTDAHLLIAEDNRMNQDLLRHLLYNWHLHFHVVNNGIEVLQALEKQHFDLVLMDIQMPEMDGYTAARKIRQELRSNIPIVAMTAHAMAGEREKCLSYGMNEYVAKPIREEELYRIIQVFTGKTGPPEWLVNHTSVPNHKELPAHLISLQYLQDLSKGDKAFEHTMLQQFIAQLPEDLSLLKAAITAADIPAIRSIAHNIKTTVAFIGLEHQLYAFLDPMEQLSDEHYDPTQTAAQFESLKQVCLQAVEEALEILL